MDADDNMNNSIDDRDGPKKSISTNILTPIRNSPEHRQHNRRQGNLVSNITNSVNSFIEDFNFLFYDQIFTKFFKEISGLNEEKYKKCFEITQGFQTQISEMENMMRDDESHKESLKVIVDNLQEEMESELKKNSEHFDSLIEDKRRSFKETSLNSAAGLQTIKEKFKIDMLNTVNDLIYPKK